MSRENCLKLAAAFLMVTGNWWSAIAETVYLYPDADTFISQWFPDNNYGTTNSLLVGKNTNGDLLRSRIHFSGIPSRATIESATLRLYRYDGNGSFELGVYLASRSWAEATLTWNTDGSTNYWTSPVSNFSLVNLEGYAYIDVTQHVQQWVDGTRANYGFHLCDTEPWNLPDGYNRGFASKENTSISERPKLTIEYTINDDNYEPNNSLSQAFNLSGDENTWLNTIDGYGIQADDDWYCITVSAGYELVLIDCQFVDSEGDIDISLYDSSGIRLADSMSTTNDEYIEYVVPESGTYYIRVFWGNAGNTYNLWWDDVRPTLVISPTSRNHTAAGGTGSISVTSNISWTASESLSWVAITSGSPGSGNGTVNYSVSENTSTSSRSGSITVSGGGITRTFTVNQERPPELTISPTSRNHPAAGGTGSISVTSNTSWTASESLSWVTITSGSSGSGDGTINYSVAANTSTSSRCCTITVSGGGVGITRTFTVCQDEPAEGEGEPTTEGEGETVVEGEGESTPSTGSLKVTIEPSGARSAGAQWRVDSGSWHSSSYTQSGLSVGSHVVSFKDISGWNTPSSKTVSIMAGDTKSITGTYSIIDEGEAETTGSLNVTIGPSGARSAGAQWRVDGGSWHNSGYTQSGLSVGSHVVSFMYISGWNTPGNRSVTITAGQTTNSRGDYTAISSNDSGCTCFKSLKTNPLEQIKKQFADWLVVGLSMVVLFSLSRMR